LFAAELDLFAMSGFHIFPASFGLARYRSRKEMIVVRGRNRQGASIPK